MQNLIVRNDRNTDYVQFTVNVPDGYNKLTVDDINGSIINQSYLSVGDTITFKFSNNPLVYKLPNELDLDYIAGDQFIEEEDQQEYFTMNQMKFNTINAMMNNYYQLVFIPVYNLYDSEYDLSEYVFNPCDPNQLLSEPVNTINNIEIRAGVELSFTGQFVMALKYVDKIPDINVLIGESISNSKMRSQDVGAYQIVNNNVDEVNVRQITREAYNYGNVWVYPVSNLIMKHKLSTLVYTSGQTSETEMLVAIRTLDDQQQVVYTTPTFDINRNQTIDADGQIVDYDNWYVTYTLQFYSYDADAHTTGNVGNLQTPNKPLKVYTQPFVHKVSNSEYAMIQSEDPIAYSVLTDGSYYPFDNSTGTISATPISAATHPFLQNSWKYSPCRKTTYGIRTQAQGRPLIQPGTYAIAEAENILPDLTHVYNVGYGEAGDWLWLYNYDDNTWTRSKLYITDSNLTMKNTYGQMYFVGKMTVGHGYLTVYRSWSTGRLPTYKYHSNQQTTSAMALQLTQNHYDVHTDNSELRTRCCDDLYINSTAEHEINLKFRPLNNNVCVIEDEKISMQHFQWSSEDDDVHVELQAFVPLQTTVTLQPVNNDIRYTPGYFVMTPGHVFLADGHETLNVQAPASDDKKFKTFNGSLMFDRSDSRITRLFSNDVTGSCLGYINDILSAKLSRYYTPVSYNALNTFVNTKESINYSNNINYLSNVLYLNDAYSGDHEVVLASCYDFVKLIGSENVVNNCFPNIVPEEQRYDCSAYDPNELTEISPPDADDASPLYYKFMHWYNSGYDTEPYLGTDNGRVGGLNLITCSNELSTTDWQADVFHNNVNGNYRPLFVCNKDKFNQHKSDVLQATLNQTYQSNDHVEDYGYVETLPCYRLYRNANFEQTDLTVTTGGVKTLHPIYLQSTPRILLNNVLYMLDFAIGRQSELLNTVLGTVVAMPMCTQIIDDWDVQQDAPMKRLFKNVAISVKIFSTAFDSYWLLNYIHGNNINYYKDNNELLDSVRTEELAADVLTNSFQTNVQLFSNKYFNFREMLDELAVVTFKQQYVEAVYYNSALINLYYNSSALEGVENTVNSYINNQTSYNNLKLCKMLVCKLGEFLQFPKILFAAANCFNNTLNVNVENYNINHYQTSFPKTYTAVDEDSKSDVTKIEESFVPQQQQKINTSLFGVMFKYHQLSVGYQQLHNELAGNEYAISKALGNRHFTLVLYDEFGRQIPNRDTSQGFSNNLYLELSLM